MGVFGALLWIAAVILQYQLFMKVLTHQRKVQIYVLITWITLFLGFTSALAYAVYGVSGFPKKRQKVFSEISTNPNNNSADGLIDYINTYGLINEPEAWNQLRAVWFAINESPNVSTEKKKEIIQFLRLKGLTMHYKEAEVIDNYGQQNTKKATH